MTLYTLRLAVDDAVLVSEMKRQHKVVVGSRTWSNCRKALAEMAVNGRALKALFGDTRVAEKERAAASRGSSHKCDFTSEYLYLLASAWGVETSLSRRKMPLLMALRGWVAGDGDFEACARGAWLLDELNGPPVGGKGLRHQGHRNADVDEGGGTARDARSHEAGRRSRKGEPCSCCCYGGGGGER